MSNAFPLATSLLAEQINQRQAELAELRAAYEALGGTYDTGDDGDESNEAEPELVEAVSVAPAANSSKPVVAAHATAPDPDETGITINGIFVALKPREAQVMTLLLEANGETVLTEDFVGQLYGGVKQRWYVQVTPLNMALKPTGAMLLSDRGLGYRLVGVCEEKP